MVAVELHRLGITLAAMGVLIAAHAPLITPSPIAMPLPLPAPGPLVIQPLFPVALGQVQLRPDPLELAAQLQALLALRGGAASNPDPGCAWTGDLNGVSQLHNQPLFAPLVTAIAGHAAGYLEALGFGLDRLCLHIQRCWPVVSELGQVVGRHHHPNAHLSAVYYLNGDGSGRGGCLRLYPPQQLNELVPGLAVGHGGPIRPGTPATAQWNAPWFDLAPRAGLLVLFPASVDHAVLENEDPDDRRFSISMDLVLTAPPALQAAVTPESSLASSAEYLAPHPDDWRAVTW